MKDKSTVIIVIDDETKKTIVQEVLTEQKYRVVVASNATEARLKFSNEQFHMAVLDMDVKGLNACDFVTGIRKKEKLKHIKDNIPILVIGANSDEFSSEFATLDNIKYLEAPFTKIELKKKLLTFTGHSDVISSNTKIIPEGEYLITEGGTSHEMYWVLSGKFMITKMNHDEENIIIGDVYPGELVGEMSFLDNLPRSASVQAREECEVLVIPQKKFIDVLEHQPRWFRSLMQTMSQRLRNSNQKIARKSVNKSIDKTSDEDHIPEV